MKSLNKINAIMLTMQPVKDTTAPHGAKYRYRKYACDHTNLTFDFDEEVVECNDCGITWRDYVGECKVVPSGTD